MRFLEKDLEQIIWEADKEMLNKRGLCLFGKVFRQFKVGNYGIIDLLEVSRGYDYPNYSYLDINILELKQDKIGISALLQAIRYAKGVQSYLLNKRNFSDFKLTITLIGSEIDMSGSLIYLTDLIGGNETASATINAIDFYTYNYEIDGVRFSKREGYSLIEEGF